jgi:glycosyltransferase involved in cell wall biosynthesis
MGWQPDLMAFVYRAHVGYDGSHASEHTHVTMPNKVYDYMAFRKPVLVSDCRPMKRLVETHRCGLVFRSQDAEDLVEKVLQLRDPHCVPNWAKTGARRWRRGIIGAWMERGWKKWCGR